MDGRNNNESVGSLISEEQKASENFYASIDSIPEEILLLILNYFQHLELHTLLLVCKKWNRIGRELHHDLIFQIHLAQFKDSQLWRFLNKIINDENIYDYYLNYFTLNNEENEENEEYNEIKLSDICRRFSHFFPASHPYGKKINGTYISELARLILSKINRFNPAASDKPHETIKELLSFPYKHHYEQMIAIHAYKELEGIFALTRLMLQCRLHVDSSPSHSISANQIIDIILYGYNSYRFLTGESIMFFDNFYVSIIPDLISISISFHNSLKKHNNGELVKKNHYNEQQLLLVDHLLNRIKISDWLMFLTSESHFAVYRTNSLLEGIKQNIIVFPENIKIELLKIIAISLKRKSNEIVINILHSDILIDCLKEEYLLELIVKLATRDIPSIFLNPQLVRRMDFKVTKALLEKDPFKGGVLLTLDGFLEQFSLKNIIEIAKYVLEEDFIQLLKSSSFLNRLNRVEDRKERSHFFVSLAQLSVHPGCYMFSAEIIKNDTILQMIDVDDIQRIALLDVRASSALSKKKEVLDKFSQLQLIEVACTNFDFGLSILKRLDEFFLEKFIEVFATDKVYPQDVLRMAAKDLRANLALLKRENIIARLDSKQIFEMASYEPTAALFIADKYLNWLTESDLKKYVEIYSNHPIFSGANRIVWKNVMTRMKRLNTEASEQSLMKENEKASPMILAPSHENKSKLKPLKKFPTKVIKAIALLFIGLVGIGLILSGAGAFIGLPLLFQVLLIGLGSFFILGSGGVGLFMLFNRNKIDKSVSTKAVSNSQTKVVNKLNHFRKPIHPTSKQNSTPDKHDQVSNLAKKSGPLTYQKPNHTKTEKKQENIIANPGLR